MTTMTKTHAAELIAAKINEATDCSANVWARGNTKRVYCRDARGRDIGYLEIGGGAEYRQGRRDSGSVKEMITKNSVVITDCVVDVLRGVVIAENAPQGTGANAATLRAAARDGNLGAVAIDHEIADAVRAGVITVSDAMNRDD